MTSPFSEEMLDDLGRCFARAAVDAFLADEAKKTAEAQAGVGGSISITRETDHGYGTDESLISQ